MRTTQTLKSAIFIGIFYALSACGPSQSSPQDPSLVKIVNGAAVEDGNPIAKSTVAIVNYGFDGKYVSSGICSGTLISPVHVLTAAHCAEDYSERMRPMVIFNDVLNEKIDDEHVRIAYSWKKHENYRFDLMTNGVSMEPINDVAIILLNAPAPEGYEPVALAPAAETMKRGDRVVIAGFGKTSGLPSSGSIGALRYAVTFFLDELPQQKEILNGRSKGQTCGGDSGGPSFVVGVDAADQPVLSVLGITSRGDEFCQVAGFSTDVRMFGDWIGKTADQLLNDAIASLKK